MTTLKLDTNLSARGHRYVVGLSTGAYLYSLGHRPIEVSTRNTRIGVIFQNTPQVREDALRYQQVIDTLMAKAQEKTVPRDVAIAAQGSR